MYSVIPVARKLCGEIREGRAAFLARRLTIAATFCRLNPADQCFEGLHGTSPSII